MLRPAVPWLRPRERPRGAVDFADRALGELCLVDRLAFGAFRAVLGLEDLALREWGRDADDRLARATLPLRRLERRRLTEALLLLRERFTDAPRELRRVPLSASAEGTPMASTTRAPSPAANHLRVRYMPCDPFIA